MKIAVFSDLHLGAAYNSELEEDSFANADEAMQKALDADIILIGGDIFDSRSPRTSVWARAIQIFTKPLTKKSGVNLVSSTKELKPVHKRTLDAIPVLALHGNHDRRSKNEINAVEAFDGAGLLIHLHKQAMVFEKDGVKVAIHAMSSVPERFAKTELNEWNPQPIEGAYNILVLHQSIDPYVYSPLEPPSLTRENLPTGFDLILDGHLHTHFTDSANGTPLIILGSTVITQFEKSEAEIEKGIFFIDCNKRKIDFVPLQNNRKFFYEQVEVNSNTKLRDSVEQKISDIIHVMNLQKPPVIKIRVSGKETEVIEQDLRYLENKYDNKVILIFVKDLESPEMTEKLEFMKNLREQKLSIEEIGINILQKNLEELKSEKLIDEEALFSLLSQGAVEKTFAILIGDQKTLHEMMSR